MKLSKEKLLVDARKNECKPENLDKVYTILDIFQQFMSITYLFEKLLLKGGTALNLFFHDSVPRLSVDLDFNYIGSLERKTMLEERATINDAIAQIMQQNRFECDRNPNYYAGDLGCYNVE